METGEEMGYTEYVDVVGEDDLGDIGDSDYETEVSRLDDCYTQVCQGTPYTILARTPRRGEAPALYGEREDGDLQILGYSIGVPSDVDDIRQEAWRLYCEGESK